MAMNDFARRMLGFDPLSMFGEQQPMQLPGAAMSNSPQANTAAIAQPTLDQLYQDDLQQAQMSRLGNLGMLLLAAGQNLTPAQRATILAQAPNAMDGAQRDAMTAAQARLMGARAQSEQADMARSEAMRNRLLEPEFLRSINITPQMADAIGLPGVQAILKNRLMANTPEAILERKKTEAELRNLEAPKIGQIGQDADGNPIYGDQRTGTPINIQGANSTAPQMQSDVPAGVNAREYRKKLADEKAKLQAADYAKQKITQEEYTPAFNDYISTFAKAAKAGAIGPMQANNSSRSVFANSENENLRQQVEAAQKRWAYAQALRTYGKLDRGFTDTELNAFLQQGLPLYSANPESALEAFKGRFGPTAGQTQATDPLAAARAAIQRGADPEKVRQRLIENGIDAGGL